MFGIETVTLKHLLQLEYKKLMISKNTIKLIKSLAKKKYRNKEKLFLVEGDKILKDVVKSKYTISQLFADEEFLQENSEIISGIKHVFSAQKQSIKKASLLQNPQNCIALCELPPPKKLTDNLNDITFYLDGIQDPGNLGTIIRTCDWFGIQNIIVSSDTVDLFNPKVIQASMGSFCRVNVLNTDPDDFRSFIKKSKIPVYGTFTNGNSIYTEKLIQKSVVVLGNEGQGIREETKELITKKISIPGFSRNTENADSLNVAITAGIICSEFKRRRI